MLKERTEKKGSLLRELDGRRKRKELEKLNDGRWKRGTGMSREKKI
jgi:hypothetical protein